MKIEKVFVLLLFCCLNINVFSVASQLWTDDPATHDGEPNVTDLPLGILEKKSRSKIQGQQYISENWKEMNILMKGQDQITNIPARINVYDSTIEILHEHKIKYIPLSLINKASLLDNPSVYITNNSLPGASPAGFYRLIYNGKSSLLCYYYPEIIKGNYNRALDIGINYNETEVRYNYFLLLDQQLFRIKKNRRSLIQVFEGQPSMQKYVKDNHIHPGNEFELLKVVEYYDNHFKN